MQWRLNESTRAYVEETMRETAALQARLAALEAAARAVAWFFLQREADGTTSCLSCHGINDHINDCPVGALAALLEEGR